MHQVAGRGPFWRTFHPSDGFTSCLRASLAAEKALPSAWRRISPRTRTLSPTPIRRSPNLSRFTCRRSGSVNVTTGSRGTRPSCTEKRRSLLPIIPFIPSSRGLRGRRIPRAFLITYEGHPARSSQRFTSPGARDGGPTLPERVARRHGRRLDRVSGQCASSNMSFVRNQEGLYEDTTYIGTRLGWEQVLASKGLMLRGHRIMSRRAAN